MAFLDERDRDDSRRIYETINSTVCEGIEYLLQAPNMTSTVELSRDSSMRLYYGDSGESNIVMFHVKGNSYNNEQLTLVKN